MYHRVTKVNATKAMPIRTVRLCMTSHHINKVSIVYLFMPALALFIKSMSDEIGQHNSVVLLVSPF